MKRLLWFLFFAFAIAGALFAQEIPEPPANWGEILLNPSQWFVSFGAITVLTAFIATFFNGLLKIEKKFFKQLIAWLVGIVLLVLSDLFNWGYAKDFPYIIAIINGFGAGLAANGVFDIPFVKTLLDALENLLKPKE